MVEVAFQNGATEKIPPAPSAPITCPSENSMKNSSTRIWNEIRMIFTRVASLMPSTFNAVVRTMKAIRKIQPGTSGN